MDGATVAIAALSLLRSEAAASRAGPGEDGRSAFSLVSGMIRH